MRRREVEALLDELVLAVPRGIREAGLTPNACILATRLGVEALRSRGVRARPLAVDLVVLNEAYARRVEAGMEPSEETEADWVASGARRLVMSDAQSELGWHGHLVLVADGRYLVDLSAGQFDRPSKGIHAKAFWVEAREVARGERVTLREDDGAVWVYEPRLGDRSYIMAPAWSAYRVTVRGGVVISERSGPRPDAPVAPAVAVRLDRERRSDAIRKA